MKSSFLNKTWAFGFSCNSAKVVLKIFIRCSLEDMKHEYQFQNLMYCIREIGKYYRLELLIKKIPF